MLRSISCGTIICIASVGMLITGCQTPATTTAAAAPATAQVASSKACIANFVSDGSFFTGYRWKTWQEHSGVPYDAALRKVAQAVAAAGWGAPTSNRDTGVITAGQAVSFGKGSVAPLNVIIQERQGGKLRVEANFSTGAGQVSATDSVRAELCKLVEAPST